MDMVTPIATQVVALLAPFLPQLTSVGQDISQGISNELQAHSFQLAQALWARLRPKTDSSPAFQTAVDDAVSQPADADAQASLRLQLKKLLADDPTLVSDLQQVLEAGGNRTTVSASGRSIAIGGDVSGSAVVIGDSNRIQQNTN